MTIHNKFPSALILRDGDSSGQRVANWVEGLGFQRVDPQRLGEVNERVRGAIRFQRGWDDSEAFSTLARAARLVLQGTASPLLDDPDLGETLPFWLKLLPNCRVIVCCNDARPTLWIGLAHLGQRPALFIDATGDHRERNRVRNFLRDGSGARSSRSALQTALYRLARPSSEVLLRLTRVLRREGWKGLQARICSVAQALGRASVRPARAGFTAAEPARCDLNGRKARLDSFLVGFETRLAFPRCERPKISVVIAAYNQAEALLECLESLLLYADVPVEIIVVDDASTDETSRLLSRIGSIVHLRNESNSHLLLTNQRGAREARGEFLLFLNQTTRIAPGCLSALLSTLSARPGGGAVGGRLIRCDGNLQEAGSIVWRDASVASYGRNDDPAKPEYNYVREVDCCSAALLLVRRSLFEELGGFDERYCPAYYEDADLCFAIRKAGFRVDYQPRAVVFLHEFAGHGCSEAERVCRENLPKFAQKWSRELARQPMPGEQLRGRDRRPGPRVLLVQDSIPDPCLGAGPSRARRILDSLTRQGAIVTFLPVSSLPTPQPATQQLQQQGVEIFYPHPTEQNVESRLERILPRPGFYSAVCVTRPHNALRFGRRLRAKFPQARLIYDAEALACLREIQAGEVAGHPRWPLDQARSVENEVGLLADFDVVMAASRRERQLIRSRHSGLRVALVGHPAQARPNAPSFENRADLLFVGRLSDDSSPNVDAIGYFVEHIFPRIQAQLPGCRFLIAGTSPTARVRALAGPSMVVTDTPEDLAALHAGCRIFIAPMRCCAEILLKIVEALAEGVPVVATAAAMVGLELEHRKNALLCSSDEEFVASVVELYHSPNLWNMLQQGGREYVRAHCNPETVQETLSQIFQLLPAPPTPKHRSSSSGPLVSICVPTYQGAPYVQAALQSALAQSYQNIEILVSDDGSTDQTVEIVSSLLEQSAVPYRVLHGPCQGMVANWTHLVDKAEGELIKFLFQDDWLETRCVERLTECFMLDARVGLVFSPRAISSTPPPRKTLSAWKSSRARLMCTYSGPSWRLSRRDRLCSRIHISFGVR